MIFSNGEQKPMPVRIGALSKELQEIFLPIKGKTVTWDGGTPKEMEQHAHNNS